MASKMEEKFLLKIWSHRIAQVGRDLVGTLMWEREFRWDHLQWWELYHVPGEELKHEELSSFCQLWSVGVNTLSWKSCLTEAPPFLLTFYIQTRQQTKKKFVKMTEMSGEEAEGCENKGNYISKGKRMWLLRK